MDAKFVTQVNVIQQGKTAIEIYTTADRSKYTYRIMRDGARLVGADFDHDSEGEALENARSWLKDEFIASALAYAAVGILGLMILGLFTIATYLTIQAGAWW